MSKNAPVVSLIPTSTGCLHAFMSGCMCIAWSTGLMITSHCHYRAQSNFIAPTLRLVVHIPGSCCLTALSDTSSLLHEFTCDARQALKTTGRQRPANLWDWNRRCGRLENASSWRAGCTGCVSTPDMRKVLQQDHLGVMAIHCHHCLSLACPTQCAHQPNTQTIAESGKELPSLPHAMQKAK